MNINFFGKVSLQKYSCPGTCYVAWANLCFLNAVIKGVLYHVQLLCMNFLILLNARVLGPVPDHRHNGE